MRAPFLPFLLFACLIVFGCGKKTETLSSDAVTDFVPLTPGKYLTYLLDSTVYVNRGRVEERHRYQEKNLVDAKVQDALGRPSYRIYRFIRDSAGTQTWRANGTYYITPTDSSIEVVDFNLRFIKLTRPVHEGFTWKGHRYFPSDPYSDFFDYQNDADIARWDYTYGATDGTLTRGTQTFQHVLTVNGVDAVLNFPVTSIGSFGVRNYMQDNYAKGIGLVYQVLTMIEYQPPSGTDPTGVYTGFTVQRTLIDHN